MRVMSVMKVLMMKMMKLAEQMSVQVQLINLTLETPSTQPRNIQPQKNQMTKTLTLIKRRRKRRS